MSIKEFNTYRFLSLILLCFFTSCSQIQNTHTGYGNSKGEIVDLINEVREKKEIFEPILNVDNNLNLLAQQHAENMAARNKLYHSSYTPNGYSLLAENIAYSSDLNNDYVVNKMWMRSYYHRLNILNKDYHYIGVGIAQSTLGNYYWCLLLSDKPQ